MSNTLANAISLEVFGGPEVMQLKAFELAAPGAGQVVMRQTAIGFNYIDVYQRKGTYPLPLPTGLGHEAIGVVEAVGSGVSNVKAGDRVGYINSGIGAYADRRVVAADKLVLIPNEISDEAAAALLFKGLTAQYLIRKTYKVGPGNLILVHAAAGGVGLILCSWAKALGATVVGTAGSAAKCEIAKAAGCDIAIDYSNENWPQLLLEATGGRKANVVYDSVGKATFMQSLDCIAPFGTMVVYGAASGPAPAIDPELLNKKGCLFLTRPSVFPHNADVATFRANAADLFAAIAAGHVKVNIGAKFALADAAKAHAEAEARRTTGSIILVP